MEDTVTVRYTGHKYSGRVDDGTEVLTPGTTQFEATGPRNAFVFTATHVAVFDREAVTIKRYQIL